MFKVHKDLKVLMEHKVLLVYKVHKDLKVQQAFKVLWEFKVLKVHKDR